MDIQKRRSQRAFPVAEIKRFAAQGLFIDFSQNRKVSLPAVVHDNSQSTVIFFIIRIAGMAVCDDCRIMSGRTAQAVLI